MLKDYYYTDKEEVRLMATKKTKEATYTQDQVRHLLADVLADVLAELTIKLKDPSLVIVGMLAMELLDKKLK